MSLLENINSPADIKGLTVDELTSLASEIRQYVIDTVLKNGGHLASNLGIVEVTLALHYVFDVPNDKIIWDVGHQSYVHKILTGRREALATLRQKDGISGFPQTNESESDIFDTGHSSTAMSIAAGMAMARDLNGEKYSVIAFVGDGSFDSGMTFEAIGDLAERKTKVIAILNDNEMCISKNVGLVSKKLYRLRTSKRYVKLKKGIERALGHGRLHNATKKLKDSIRYMMLPTRFFDELGFKYVGPIDGHNLSELIEQLKRAREEEFSCVLHVVTQKGRGYAEAESDPETYHGVAPFYVDKSNGIAEKQNFSEAAGNILTEMAKEDDKIVAFSAAMIQGTGLSSFAAEFPDRTFDVGICEEHAATMAAAMAASGFKPFYAVYSSFMQRCYDQLLEDVCLAGNKITLLIDRAGLTGNDGKTHQGIYDVALLRTMPNMVIMSPSNITELEEMMRLSLTINSPCAIRYAKSSEVCSYEHVNVELGKWVRLINGQEIALISHGSMLAEVNKAVPMLNERGIFPSLINARFLKPLDENIVKSIYRYRDVYIIEDSVAQGGLGSAVNEYISTHDVKETRIHILAVRDEAVQHAKISEQRSMQELDAEAIVRRIIENQKRPVKPIDKKKIK